MQPLRNSLLTTLADLGLREPIRNLRRSLRLRAVAKQDYQTLSEMRATGQDRFMHSWSQRMLMLQDKTEATGFDRHYVYHPAWAARILASTRPEYHIDISSTLHFCSIVSAFIPVHFYDYRPANLTLTGLATGAKDLTQLDFPDGSIGSLSCMHTVEHIGLGRYGDPIDHDGDLKAIRELTRVLAPGGHLLFVVPTGHRNALIYNAHRIYTRDAIVSYFSSLQLVEFTLIPEHPTDGGLVPNPSDSLMNRQEYGCGCFWFRKN
jgi:hypothetical protein